MLPFSIVSPKRVGFLPERLEQAGDLMQRWSESGEVAASALCVGRRGGVVEPRAYGVKAGGLFWVASITKPLVAAAVVRLIERGHITLDDRVADFVPEFAENGKENVGLRHLLTHTSGLCDQLPENVALRAAHAPLSAFVEGTCRQSLLFTPGTMVRYQSMGFTMLGEIVARVSGLSLAEFLRREFFEPLGMADTSLGAPDDWAGRIVPVQLNDEQAASDWNYNTPYWRSLGSPWGGLVSSPLDLARFCRMMLDEGELGKVRVLSPASVRAMTTNQLVGFPLLPEEERRCRPWGLGWRLRWPGQSSHFGDLLGLNAYGHWGATGCMLWIDPDADAFCILCTSRQPGDDGRYLARLSNAVAAALL